jgi:putative ABC transport system permease protein
MMPALWLSYAWRDLRSGLQGFWIFLTCIALGTAAIAMVGSLSAAIQRGMIEQGQPLMGGDIEFAIIHREATTAELAFMTSKGEVSRVATLRAMAVAGESTALIEAKAVDRLYPLYGTLELQGTTFSDQLSGAGGILADPLLTGRLGIAPGARVKIGNAEFELKGLIAREPDRLADGIILGPRVLMSEAALNASGLVQPGSLITWRYRLKLPGDASLRSVKAIEREAKAKFPDAGWRIRTRDRAAAGADRFVERLSYFLTLVGLTALIVSGAGIANAVSAFVDRRTDSIATLKCLGAPSASVFAIYMTEILLVGLMAVAIGLVAGALTPLLAYEFVKDLLPLPLTARVEWWPLAIAGLFGLLVTIAFAIWPMAQTRHIPGSALFRHRVAGASAWPSMLELAAIAASLAAIAALAYASFDDRRITVYYLLGLAGSFIVLLGLAWGIVRLAARAPKASSAIWRYAIANLNRPGSAAISVILALGLGLTLFVALALTDRTISRELSSGLADKAPAFFFLDVPNGERQQFIAALEDQPGVKSIEYAPMLRGRMVKVGDTPAEKVQASPDAAWALRGDRGLTYADTLPEGSTLVEGEWWPKDYEGPPLVSFVDEIARGIGLEIGDKVTVNVLGRDVTATVANLRSVNWRTLNINFVMVFTPNALRAAPHNHLVTVEMNGGDEAKLLNAMARAFPTVTAVRVKDALETVNELLGQMLAAIRGANALTLLTGVLVLAGALAAGLSSRIYDAVVLKTYGATRRQLITAFMIEYASLGLAAAVFGVIAGSLASWFLAKWILEMPWSFSAATAALTALTAMLLTILGGLSVTWRALSARPAFYLRNE